MKTENNLIAAVMNEHGVVQMCYDTDNIVEYIPIYPRLNDIFMPSGFSCMHPTEKDIIDGGDRVV
jgi:hypothetical protein